MSTVNVKETTMPAPFNATHAITVTRRGATTVPICDSYQIAPIEPNTIAGYAGIVAYLKGAPAAARPGGGVMAADANPPRRYFRVDGGGPTWWFVAPTPAHAWSQWAEWHLDTGATEEPLTADPRMVELTLDEARAVKVADDPVGSNLAALELGATICTEF